MTAFVKECRQEWKRLGVPDLLADEMAADLEADLAEAEAEGVSTAEIVGESDPRRFAATWARERGLVSEPPPRKRRRLWMWVVAAVVLFVVVMVLLALGAWATTVSVGPAQPQTVRSVARPSFVGLTACKAVRTARRARLKVRISGHAHGYSCDAVVARENESVKGSHRSVTLWLRRARR
jgi:hypothetical protein